MGKDGSDKHPHQGYRNHCDVFIYNSQSLRYIQYPCPYRGELNISSFFIYSDTPLLDDNFFHSNLPKQKVLEPSYPLECL